MQAVEIKAATTLLEKPVRITEQVWPDGTVPVVSIFCITYNHVDFIRDAIEGFLMQETTFPVEIFIHDDASTDGTADIVKEYAKRYPKLFWTIIQKKNQFSKGNQKVLLSYLVKQRGKYIALCEGDDYWTLSNKIEKQVRFISRKRDCAGVFHRSIIVDGIKNTLVHDWEGIKYKESYSQKECLFKLMSCYHTSSLLFKKQCIVNVGVTDFWYRNPSDHTLDVHLTKYGDLSFMNFFGSAYRIHVGGIWSGVLPIRRHSMMVERLLDFLSDKQLYQKYHIELLQELYQSYDKLWWCIYKQESGSWPMALIKAFNSIKKIKHVILFAKYSLTKESPIRFHLRDWLKGSYE
jgi:glycosyltransferase involved in cell wall biosynthesis